jgi:hypothetical protein
VHVQAIGATVDLRRAHPDEVEQAMIQAPLTDLPLEAEHGLDDAWVHLHEIDSSLHDVFRLHSSRRIRKQSCDTRGHGTPVSQTAAFVRLESGRASRVDHGGD